MKVYTKFGDRGRTQLLGGVEIAKSDWRIEAIGQVDELNAAIGLAKVESEEPMLEKIQCWLFDLGSSLACEPGGKWDLAGPGAHETAQLEQSIDEMSSKLPPLKNFILPGGHLASARLHVARSVCRRAERALWKLSEAAPVPNETMVFVNRLSDWLFVAARQENAAHGVADIPWRKLGKDSK